MLKKARKIIRKVPINIFLFNAFTMFDLLQSLIAQEKITVKILRLSKHFHFLDS